MFPYVIETLVEVWKNSKLRENTSCPSGPCPHFNFSFCQTSTRVSITVWKHGKCFLFLKYNTTQHNTPRHNTTQHNTTQHSTAQHSTAQHSTAQHSTAQHSTAQHSTAQHSTAQHSTAQHSTAQHSTAQHSTAQHSTAQHSTAQHKSLWEFERFVCTRLYKHRASNLFYHTFHNNCGYLYLNVFNLSKPLADTFPFVTNWYAGKYGYMLKSPLINQGVVPFSVEANLWSCCKNRDTCNACITGSLHFPNVKWTLPKNIQI